MMRTIYISMVLSIALGSFAGTVARLTWQVETARPLSRTWPLVYGETVDLECQYTSYRTPMDMTGATVILHARTNGMPAGLSYQATGTVGRVGSPAEASNGWITVRLDVDRVLPADHTTIEYAIDTSLSGSRLLRASGAFAMTGTAAGLSAAPQPASYDPVGSAAAVSNALAAALQTVSDTLAGHTHDGRYDPAGSAAGVAVSVAATSALDRVWSKEYVASVAPTLSVAAAREVAQSDSNAWITVANGTGVLYRVGQLDGTIYITRSSPDFNGPAVGTVFGYFETNDGTRSYTNSSYRIDGDTSEDIWSLESANGGIWAKIGTGEPILPATLTATPPMGGDPDAIGSVTIDWHVTSNKYYALAIDDDLKTRPTYQTVSNMLSAYSIPTNVVVGWRVWDAGSNRFWTVCATNLRFYVLE